MSQSSTPAAAEASPEIASPTTETTVMAILWALSLSHLLNDTLQSLIPAIYPVLKTSFGLTFAQIGMITFTFQVTASLLQPVIGFYTDRHPKPYSLAIGMGVTLVGLVLMSRATSFHAIIIASGCVGAGSAVFHPEASRMARLASGGKHGLAQSLFQVGGNLGSSFGPLLAAMVVVPHGQGSILWFSVLALAGIFILSKVGGWYQQRLAAAPPRKAGGNSGRHASLSRGRVVGALFILIMLIFSKYFYLVSLTNYYTFYLIHRFHVSVHESQIYLFVFLFSVAAGTFFGGIDKRDEADKNHLLLVGYGELFLVRWHFTVTDGEHPEPVGALGLVDGIDLLPACIGHGNNRPVPF